MGIAKHHIRAALAGLAVALFAVPSAVQWWGLATLRDRGAVVPGRVVRTRIDATGRRSEDVIWYEFTPAGGAAPIRGMERFRRGPLADVDSAELHRFLRAAELPVRYLPDRPQSHRLDIAIAERAAGAGRTGLLLLAAAAAVAVGCLIAWRG
jgi:hypothetical protein